MVIELNQKNKQLVWDFWQHLEAGSADQLVQIAHESLVSDAVSTGRRNTLAKSFGRCFKV